MSNEDFVTYEQAIKLRAAGFDWNCEYVYAAELPGHEPFSTREDGVRYFQLTGKSLFASNTFPAPTLWKAQKWLREKKRWHVEVRINGCRNMFGVELWEMRANGGAFRLQHEDGHAMLYDTYESALAAGIESALKLIEEGER